MALVFSGHLARLRRQGVFEGHYDASGQRVPGPQPTSSLRADVLRGSFQVKAKIKSTPPAMALWNFNMGSSCGGSGGCLRCGPRRSLRSSLGGYPNRKTGGSSFRNLDSVDFVIFPQGLLGFPSSDPPFEISSDQPTSRFCFN